MKTRSYLGMIALAVMSFTACKNTNEPQKEDEPQVEETTEVASGQEVVGGVEKANFEIKGMTCAMGCAKMIEGKLAALDGVKKATVDFDNESAVVEFDDAKQSPESITTTVEKLVNGAYKVENMTVSEVENAI